MAKNKRGSGPLLDVALSQIQRTCNGSIVSTLTEAQVHSVAARVGFAVRRGEFSEISVHGGDFQEAHEETGQAAFGGSISFPKFCE
jgi:hypothetical protein